MPDFIDQLRFRLLELGCPLRRVQRMVQEVADHREDLIQAALDEGRNASDAKFQADASLGDPQTLAQNLMVSVRQSSWCGRHRFVAFVLLPLLGYPLLWGVVFLVNLALGFALGFGWDDKRFDAASDNPAMFHYLAMVVRGVDYLAAALVVLLLCQRAGRSAAGWHWMMFTAAICSVYSLFIYAYLTPHNLSLGIGSQPQWIRAGIPLLIFGIFDLNRRRLVRHALRSATA